MKAVVTGGAGFLGGHVVRRLDALGWSVAALDDLSAGRRENIPESVQLDVIDIASDDAVEAISARAPDVVIHAAAQISVARSMNNPDEDWRINVLGMRRVIQAARRAEARVVFLSSGGAIYGETDGADEATTPAPCSYYGVHKYVAERYLEFSGLGFGIARLANAYGPGQRVDQEGGVIAIFADALKARSKITIHGTGEQRRDFVHASDVAAAVVCLATTSMNGTWNVASGVATSIRDVLGSLEAAFGGSVQISHGPARAGDVFSSRLVVDRIRQDLGWTPTIPIEVGVRTLAGRALQDHT